MTCPGAGHVTDLVPIQEASRELPGPRLHRPHPGGRVRSEMIADVLAEAGLSATATLATASEPAGPHRRLDGGATQ